MRVAVIGAGAIGSTLGGLLSRKGHDVVFVARPAQVAALSDTGLWLEGCLGEHLIRAEGQPRLDRRPDVALLTVKSQDVTTAVRENLPFLEGVPLVTMQNGVRGDDLVAALLPREQIHSAVVFLHAIYLGPGRVTISYPGPLVLGRPFGANDEGLGTVAALLRQVVQVSLSDNIAGVHWSKLIMNLNNAVPALTDLPVGRVYEHPYLSRLCLRLMREGLRVCDKAGIRLEPMPGTSRLQIKLAGILPEGLALGMAVRKVRQMEASAPTIPSTLQSIRRRRPTEVDFLNGEVAALGRQVGVPVPLNETVVGLVRRVEATGVYMSPSEVQSAIEVGPSGPSRLGAQN